MIGSGRGSVEPLSAISSDVAERGHAVIPGLYDERQVDRLRDALHGVYRDAGEPVPYDAGLRWLEPNIEITKTGFVVHKLLSFVPELHRGCLVPEAVEIVRGALGRDMHLEMVGGVVTNHERPFFEWHMHVGGIDDELYRRRGWRPRWDTPQRVAMLVYLEEMGPDTGQLLVYPRRATDPIEPPHPTTWEHWEGEVAVTGPAGTVVLLEQSTWHAVLPRTVDRSLRSFVGFWFAASSATEAERIDESLWSIAPKDDLFASVLPRRAGR